MQQKSKKRMMQRMKQFIVAILVAFVVTFGLSFVPPKGETFEKARPAQNMGGSWKLTASATPWQGITACHWTWWAGETCTPVSQEFLVRGKVPARVEDSTSRFGLVLGGFRPWIFWAGIGSFLLVLLLLWPRPQKVGTDENGHFESSSEPRVDLREERSGI